MINWLIRGKDGRIYIFQLPNLPIIGWFVCMITSNFLPAGSIKVGFSHLSLVFLAIWCYLEITTGVSRFRQILGIIIAALVIYNFFR